MKQNNVNSIVDMLAVNIVTITSAPVDPLKRVWISSCSCRTKTSSCWINLPLFWLTLVAVDEGN